MASIRNQMPDENSRIQQLKLFMRDLSLSNKPFVTYSPAEDGSNFQVNIGRSKLDRNGGSKSSGGGSERRTVKMVVWQDGSRYFANFDLPQWAKDVAPTKDSNKIYVFKHSGGDKMGSERSQGESGSFIGVRIRVQDKDEFMNLVSKTVSQIIDALRGKSKDGESREEVPETQEEAAFPIVGVPINEEVYYENACTFPFNYSGNGEGGYLAVKTSGSTGKAVVEMLGPIPARDPRGGELKIESLHLGEGWKPLVKVNANNRQEALSQAAQYFVDSGFETEQTYGTLHIHNPKVLSESRLGKTKALVAEASSRGTKVVLKARSTGNMGEGEHFVIDLHDEHGRAVPLGGAFKKRGGYEDDSTGVFHKSMKDFKDYYLKRAKDGEYGNTVQTSAELVKEGVGEEGARSPRVIAREIKKLWPKPNYAAVPYLDAMLELNSVDDNFFGDEGRHIINYFLGNATSWRGPDAKRIKAELKAMIK